MDSIIIATDEIGQTFETVMVKMVGMVDGEQHAILRYVGTEDVDLWPYSALTFPDEQR